MKNTVLILSLVGLAIFCAGCGGKEERINEHFQKGQSSYDQGNYEKARVEFKNVLQIDPKHVAALTQMGKTLEKLENFQGAGSHYTRATESDPSYIESKVRLARLYFLGGNIEKASTLAEEAIKLDPQAASALTVRAGVNAKTNNKEKAIIDAEQALRLDPGQLDAVYLLAALYKESKGEDFVINFLEKTIANYPNEIGLRTILADFYSDENRKSDVERVLREIVNLNTNDLSHYVALSRFLVSQERVSEAQKVISDAINVLKDDKVKAKIVLAELLYTTEHKSEAEEKLLGYIADEPKEYEFYFSLASLYSSEKEIEKAVSTLKQAIKLAKDSPKGLEARIRLAKVHLQNADYQLAKVLVDEVLEINGQDRTGLSLRANLAIRDGDNERAIADYRTILKDSPDSPDVLTNLARVYIKNDQHELAIDSLKKVAKLNPRDSNAQLMLVSLYINRGQPNNALPLISTVLKNEPENVAALEFGARAFISEKNWQEAEVYSSKLEAILPNKPLGYYLTGLALVGKGENAKGREKLLHVLDIAPDSVEAMNVLVRSYLEDKQGDKALKLVDGILDRVKSHVVAQNLRGEILLLKGDESKAMAAFNQAINMNKEFYIPYRNIADIYVADKKLEKAIKILNEGIEASTSVALMFKLAALYEKNQNIDKAISLYEEIIDREPSSDIAANNLAMLLANHKFNDEKSLERAATLTQSFRNSTNPAYLDTVGFVHYKRSEFERAVNLFKQALLKAPESPLLRYHLGSAQFRLGLKDEAKDNLLAALASESNFPGRDEAELLLASFENR